MQPGPLAGTLSRISGLSAPEGECHAHQVRRFEEEFERELEKQQQEQLEQEQINQKEVTQRIAVSGRGALL
jgi:hypothetical protein